MTRITAAAALLFVAATATAQDISQLYTRPAVPTRQALDRLNLQLAWRARLPMDGRRDGFFSVQVFHDRIIVQTRSGTLVSLNPADGSTQWRANFDVAYRITQEVGVNSKFVFAVRGPHLYALDGGSGRQEWVAPLTDAPSAAPAADDEQLYLCVGADRLLIYELPKLELLAQLAAAKAADEKRGSSTSAKDDSGYSISGTAGNAVGPLSSARQAGASLARGHQPVLVAEHRSATHLAQTPLVWENLLVVAGSNGSYFTLSTVDGRIRDTFETQAPVPVRLGQYGGEVFVAAQDYNAYARDITSGHLIWRHTGVAPVVKAPVVLEQDVYLMSPLDGLHRVTRKEGELAWTKATAVRFLAANRKTVYAADPTGRMLLLDRQRGTTLGTFDSRDFPFPIINDISDRIFLAAHDGLLLCLNDREQAAPMFHRPAPVEKKAAPAKRLGDKPKPAAKDADKDADKPADKDADKPAGKPEKNEK